MNHQWIFELLTNVTQTSYYRPRQGFGLWYILLVSAYYGEFNMKIY